MSNRQRLYGNTFQQSDRAIVSNYMKTLFSDRAIAGDHQWPYALVIPAIQRSWAIIWKLGLKAWFPYDRSRSPDCWKYYQQSPAIIWKHFSAIGRSSAIISDPTLLSDSSDQVSVSDHMETRLKSLDSTRSLTIIGSLKILPAIVSD